MLKTAVGDTPASYCQVKEIRKTFNTKTMKLTQINSGTLSAKGNLSGYNATGERIHISKQQVAALFGEKEPSFPFFANIGMKTLPVDAEDATKGTFDRLQAFSVFKTKEAAIEAVNSDAELEMTAKAQLAVKAAELKLDIAAVQSILATSSGF